MFKIKEVIGFILCEDILSGDVVESFIDLLCVLRSGNVHSALTRAQVRGIFLSIKRLMRNDAFCLKLISTFDEGLSDEESNAIHP